MQKERYFIKLTSDDINSLIAHYLDKYEYTQTLNVFKQECNYYSDINHNLIDIVGLGMRYIVEVEHLGAKCDKLHDINNKCGCFGSSGKKSSVRTGSSRIKKIGLENCGINRPKNNETTFKINCIETEISECNNKSSEYETAKKIRMLDSDKGSIVSNVVIDKVNINTKEKKKSNASIFGLRNKNSDVDKVVINDTSKVVGNDKEKDIVVSDITTNKESVEDKIIVIESVKEKNINDKKENGVGKTELTTVKNTTKAGLKKTKKAVVIKKKSLTESNRNKYMLMNSKNDTSELKETNSNNLDVLVSGENIKSNYLEKPIYKDILAESNEEHRINFERVIKVLEELKKDDDIELQRFCSKRRKKEAEIVKEDVVIKPKRQYNRAKKNKNSQNDSLIKLNESKAELKSNNKVEIDVKQVNDFKLDAEEKIVEEDNTQNCINNSLLIVKEERILPKSKTSKKKKVDNMDIKNDDINIKNDNTKNDAGVKNKLDEGSLNAQKIEFDIDLKPKEPENFDIKDVSLISKEEDSRTNQSNKVIAHKTIPLNTHLAETSLCVWNNRILCTASDDGTIKFFKGECIFEKRLNGMPTAVAFVGDSVAVGRHDGIINVLNVKNKTEKEIQSHGRIDVIKIIEGCVYSGSNTGTVTIENQKIKISENKITDLEKIGKKLAISSSDGIIDFINLEGNTRGVGLSGHKTQINLLTIYKNYLLSGSVDGTIKIWDVKRMRCVDTIFIGANVLCIKIMNGLIYAGCGNGEINVFNGSKLVNTFLHGTPVYAMSSGNFIVSGGVCGMLKFWNEKDGQIWQYDSEVPVYSIEFDESGELLCVCSKGRCPIVLNFK